jgi:hypothetical protein
LITAANVASAAAKQVAVTGGLTTTATHIMPPGPAPQPAGTAAARNAYVRKVAVYAKAAKAVTDARLYERRIQRGLAAGPLKDLATATDLGIGATVGAAATSSRLRMAKDGAKAAAASPWWASGSPRWAWAWTSRAAPTH